MGRNSSIIDNSYAIGKVTGGVSDSGSVGGLVGLAEGGSIDDSYATGSVSGSYIVGGLVGFSISSSSITNSFATGNVSTAGGYDEYVGGLVGYNVSSSITNSYATGSVSGGNNVGGLVGYNRNSSSIDNSYATGNVSGSGGSVGGLVGTNYKASIDDSYATGSVSGNDWVGGLVGYNYDSSSIANSFATGSVNSSTNVGGLIGYDDTSNTLTNNWWYNSLNNGIGNNGPDTSAGHWQEANSASDFYSSSQAVYSTWDFNGLWKDGAGLTYPTLIWQGMNNGSFIGGTASIPFLIHNVNQLQFMEYALSDSFQLASDIDASATSGWNSGAGFTPVGNSSTPFTGTFNGDNYTISDLFINLPTTNDVGLFGKTSGSNIENVGLINANITGQNNVGTLVGYNNNSSSIDNSYATGNVIGSGYDVGGLVGYNNNSSSIDNSYATGNVIGSAYGVGGLVGYNNNLSNISNSYATGNVIGSSYSVGGLVGVNQSSSIDNSYATGSVSGGEYVGGLVGYNLDLSSIKNNYATGSVGGSVGIGGLIGYDDGSNTLTNNWWYNSLNNGIGNNGSNISVGHWQETGSVADFYSPANPVYAIGTAGQWDIFTPIWDTYVDELPHLHWENHSGNLNSIWIGSNSTDWDTATNWTLNSVPGISSGVVIFSGTYEPTLSSNTSIADFSIGSGTFTQNGALSVSGNYLQSGGIYDQNADLTFGNNFSQFGGAFVSNSANTFSVGNNFSLMGGTFSRFTGLGTSLDPYLIYDVYGLQGMGGFLSSTFGLANDIDATITSNWNSGEGFIPIGNSGTPFTGTFNGNNYTISDLFINLPTTNNVGLFGYTRGATIENVGLVSVNITGHNNVGGLVGWNWSGSIANSYTTGNVNGYYYIGGLVGQNYNSGSIANSYASVSVSGGGQGAGGLVGYNNSSSSIDNSYATGSVNGALSAGGLVGINSRWSRIDNSYAIGSVSGYYGYVGGLVGLNNSFSSIDNSYATGSVSGSSNIGGLVGSNGAGFSGSSSISNSYATGSVSGSGNDVGGLVGYNVSSSSIDNSYATGSVSGGSYVGGLVGWNNYHSSIDNSYANGTVNGTSNVGGLVGFNSQSGSITNSFAVGSVSGSSNVGGLIGNDDGTTTLTNNWWYNSLSQGIGNNGSNTSVGHWQEAGGIADFYSLLDPVYAVGTPGGWDIYTPIWDTYLDELPHLHWEHHAGDSTPYWLGITSSDFDTATNWSNDSVPGIDSTVIIFSGINQPTLSTTTILANLLVGSGTFTQDAISDIVWPLCPRRRDI